MKVLVEEPARSTPTWNLLLILPSLKVDVPCPFATDWVRICAGTDPVLQQLENTLADATMVELCGKFSSTYGNPYRPSVLLVRTDAPQGTRTLEALTAFRNVCCAAAITYTPNFAIRGQTHRWEQAHGDHFLFCPDTAGRDGGILRHGTIVTGWTDEVANFHGHPSYLIERPDHFNFNVDLVLLGRLFAVWKAPFIEGTESQQARRLFRALEVAFHASRHPSVSLGISVNDVGTRIALWVSAFEVLFHPDDHDVRKSDVIAALGRAPWTEERLLDARFSTPSGVTLTFPQRIYDELHSARNAFLHGNAVSFDSLVLTCSESRPPLAVFAPVLFNAGLRAFLSDKFPSEETEDERSEDGLAGFSDIEEALVAAL